LEEVEELSCDRWSMIWFVKKSGSDGTPARLSEMRARSVTI
jgi:streptogramin lyase